MASTIQEWVAQLGSENAAEAFKAYKQLEETATRASAPGSEAKCAEVAAELAAELNAIKTPATKNEKGKDVPPQPKYSSTVRGKICRLLACVGGANQVPALVKAIGELEVREMARWSLDRNRSEAATDALIKALNEVGTEFRVGVVGSLGKRKCAMAMAALQDVANADAEPEVRINAVEVLANFPEPANADVILKATQCACPLHSTRAWKAAVRLAENLRKAGKKSDAAALDRKIGSGAPAAQKTAAKIGLAATS